MQYNNLFFQALRNCTANSLNAIKKRVCARSGTGFLFLERPFFEVSVQLAVPSVSLNPSLDDIQRAINKVGAGHAVGSDAACIVSAGPWRATRPSVALDFHASPTLSSRPQSALAVLRCSRMIADWGQSALPPQRRRSFFDRIGKDIEIVRVVLLLTGGVQGTRNQVTKYLSTFHKVSPPVGRCRRRSPDHPGIPHPRSTIGFGRKTWS